MIWKSVSSIPLKFSDIISLSRRWDTDKIVSLKTEHHLAFGFILKAPLGRGLGGAQGFESGKILFIFYFQKMIYVPVCHVTYLEKCVTCLGSHMEWWLSHRKKPCSGSQALCSTEYSSYISVMGTWSQTQQSLLFRSKVRKRNECDMTFLRG